MHEKRIPLLLDFCNRRINNIFTKCFCWVLKQKKKFFTSSSSSSFDGVNFRNLPTKHFIWILYFKHQWCMYINFKKLHCLLSNFRVTISWMNITKSKKSMNWIKIETLNGTYTFLAFLSSIFIFFWTFFSSLKTIRKKKGIKCTIVSISLWYNVFLW